MSEKTYNGPERRKYFRYNVIFSPRQRTSLKIGDQLFRVLDYSEGGLRFQKQGNLEITSRIDGTLIHSDGKSVEIVGEIVWQTDGEVGLKYTV